MITMLQSYHPDASIVPTSSKVPPTSFEQISEMVMQVKPTPKIWTSNCTESCLFVNLKQRKCPLLVKIKLLNGV